MFCDLGYMCYGDPLEIIKKMNGVVDAFYLDSSILERIEKEELSVKAVGSIDVINEGFIQAIKREKVICIVKDPRFRPPPEPTVKLMSDDGEVMGIEVFPETSKEFRDREDVIWLSDGFVVFPSIVPNRKSKEFFVMPPVSFPELNEGNGCKDVISCSPAPTCDKIIREWRGLEDNFRLASVLVAFNRINQ